MSAGEAGRCGSRREGLGDAWGLVKNSGVCLCVDSRADSRPEAMGEWPLRAGQVTQSVFGGGENISSQGAGYEKALRGAENNSHLRNVRKKPPPVAGGKETAGAESIRSPSDLCSLTLKERSGGQQLSLLFATESGANSPAGPNEYRLPGRLA